MYVFMYACMHVCMYVQVSIVKSHDLVQKSCDLSQLPILLRPRQDYVEYYVEHAHDRFYVFTNLGQEMEYKVNCLTSHWPLNKQSLSDVTSIMFEAVLSFNSVTTWYHRWMEVH